MVTYLDTSSLVKLYIEEEQSSDVQALADISAVLATSLVAYAEARAAFARRYRERAFTADNYQKLKTFFDQDWPRYLIVNLSNKTIHLAGELAEKHALRGFDAIHLSSALTLQTELSLPVVFSCFDDHLSNAAGRENLKIP